MGYHLYHLYIQHFSQTRHTEFCLAEETRYPVLSCLAHSHACTWLLYINIIWYVENCQTLRHPDKARPCKTRQDNTWGSGTQAGRCPLVLKNHYGTNNEVLKYAERLMPIQTIHIDETPWWDNGKSEVLDLFKEPIWISLRNKVADVS